MKNTSSTQNSSGKNADWGRDDSLAMSTVAARTRRTRLFQRADRWFNRLVLLATAVHEGFWLACLSVDELNTVTARHYGQSQESISPEGNRRGFFDWEHAAVEQYFPAGAHVLVAGAGGGREILALRHAGHSAEGFECNRALVDASNAIFDQLGETRGITFCPPDQVPSGPSSYNGIIVGWTAYSHIATRERRVAFLRVLCQRAHPGSPMLISFFSRSGDSPYDVLAVRFASWIRRLVRGRKEPLEIGDHLNWSYSHWFTREQIESELREAGIRPVHLGNVGEGYAVGMIE
jgi:hypothetical protein